MGQMLLNAGAGGLASVAFASKTRGREGKGRELKGRERGERGGGRCMRHRQNGSHILPGDVRPRGRQPKQGPE